MILCYKRIFLGLTFIRPGGEDSCNSHVRVTCYTTFQQSETIAFCCSSQLLHLWTLRWHLWRRHRPALCVGGCVCYQNQTNKTIFINPLGKLFLALPFLLYIKEVKQCCFMSKYTKQKLHNRNFINSSNTCHTVTPCLSYSISHWLFL